ncbi:MAG: OmpH family outer membrane protein [Candidatus Hydrogenedentes bacterium]|nr:OmpH family outer membrane protein [Candidatus Hydrogenedentota bacterium]
MSHMTSLKIVSVLLLGMFAAFAAVLPAAAQENKTAAASGATQYKIGVVDMSVLLNEYNKRKVLYDQLQKEVDEKQKELDAMEAAINKDKASYDSQRDGMSEDARIEMRTKIETAITNYKAAMQTRQRMIDNNEERVMKELVGDIQKTIAKVGESEGYHIILNSAGEGGPRAALLYHSTTVDMTSKVLALLNK